MKMKTFKLSHSNLIPSNDKFVDIFFYYNCHESLSQSSSKNNHYYYNERKIKDKLLNVKYNNIDTNF